MEEKELEKERGIECLPMAGKHLERRDHLSERHRPVAQPLVVVFDAVEENEEVLVLALVVDLDVVDVSSCHFRLCVLFFPFTGFGSLKVVKEGR